MNVTTDDECGPHVMRCIGCGEDTSRECDWPTRVEARARVVAEYERIVTLTHRQTASLMQHEIELARLTAENARLTADAERYRFIRSHPVIGWETLEDGPAVSMLGVWYESLDAAIDNARKS